MVRIWIYVKKLDNRNGEFIQIPTALRLLPSVLKEGEVRPFL